MQQGLVPVHSFTLFSSYSSFLFFEKKAPVTSHSALHGVYQRCVLAGMFFFFLGGGVPPTDVGLGV